VYTYTPVTTSCWQLVAVEAQQLTLVLLWGSCLVCGG
jgi:hypothetical protein